MASAIIAITQAVIIALSLMLGGYAIYRRMGEVSRGVNSIEGSVDNVADSIKKVDLKEMEKAILKIRWSLDEGFQSDNSVEHHLERTGLDVRISLAPHADRQAHMRDFEDRMPITDTERIGETIVNLEFSGQLYTKAVSDQIQRDDELLEIERELFNAEPGFSARSPFEISFTVPTKDYELIAQWIPTLLDKIDLYQYMFEEETDRFDRAIEAGLAGSEDDN